MDSHPSLMGRSITNSNRSSLDLGRLSSSSSSSPSPLTKSISDASSQSLSSILNNPHGGKSGVYGSDASWVGWWSSSTFVAPSEFAPVASTKLPGSELTRSDFHGYVSSISESHGRFEDIRKHTREESSGFDQESHVSGLAACLREVPSLYFKEDFALEDGATFRSACPFSSLNENLALQEKLSQYLDVVELHLVKEISVRSDSFFEAQGQLQDLNVKIVEGCSRIRELKETIRLLDRNLVDSARQIQELSSTRINMLELQRKLRLILYVNQALSALKLLVASADCAGALDITDDLQNLLAGDELTGLYCFRHLRDHVTSSIDSINSILTSEFMRISIHDTGEIDVLILSAAKIRGSISSNGKTGEEVKLEEEDTSTLCDRLLPLVIGLLRTAKFPSILRMYRDTLTSEMKNAIKKAVAELLPILVARSLESDFSHGERSVDVDGGGLSLASKLRTLSSEAFVNLLTAIFKIVQAHLVRASEVKKAIEWILCNIDGHYAADSVAAAIAVGAVAAETAQETGFQGGSLVSSPLGKTTSKALPLQGKSSDASSLMNMSRNFRADVLRENTEAVFAACEVTHGRWAKLLGVRSLLHPKLKLQEFMSIYDLTQEFITVTEKIGGRLGSSIRGTLQSQAKAFVDSQHEARMTKLKAVLDQETWDEIDVPEEFQSIIISLFASQQLISGKVDDADLKTYHSNRLPLNGSLTSGTEDQNTESSEGPAVSDAQVKSTVSPESLERSKAGVSSVTNNQSNQKAHGKSNLFYQGVGYHMVNCGLILLKMLSEYIDMNNSLPALSSEIVRRVVEVLRFFNTRTCQLVLGAGAMQVSGLKSIKAKHLALASQVIDFTYTIIPETRRILFSKVPETRKPLLSVEMDKVAQDYRIHRDEIYTKLVQIMRERLLAHLHGLPKVVEGWNRPPDTNKQTKEFAWPLTREVGYLHRVLSETLHEADVQAIFRQVISIIHTQTSQTLTNLEISSPEAKKRLKLHVELILKCIRSLPSDNANQSGIPNWGQLDEYFAQHFREEEAGEAE
ncbi:Vacuolar protein sorting-associated protein 54 C-terminal [Arabidopsis thaliana x Arabidopsis arenosa]|uniref:Vacuolar protein sorting-associated protein 54 C-terminal n=1 Tax=Arabidopsis thaliana x Arabidopsis arenosa TaxID=1240361 RepID=A0A8T1Y5E7_9BRAS|nr:Vacuolar protein sorting-associated protein 54 C-terminal [Arabidopsis thaliana x Arabidopsis arenosa]KAG7542227.1 Vacuolar protein sorting-associated protein 54 C-terminal [Arabidopsis thaliana x Arabidopsis arenosa]KAG7542228.1 Vacuolar protein sorting-associated protein 54 C-terminal [Arabidopsis thaliana x Arabidopsis arenosa]